MSGWDALPRMLNELCEGCPNICSEVYRYDLPGGRRLWLCKGCYVREANPPIRIDLTAVAAARRRGVH